MIPAIALLVVGAVLIRSGWFKVPLAAAALGEGSSGGAGSMGGASSSSGTPAGTLPAPAPGIGNGNVTYRPGSARPGVAPTGILRSGLTALSMALGGPVVVGTTTNHSRLTVDGNVSDHWDGHAADIPVPIDSPTGDRIALTLLRLCGISRDQATGMVKQGGLWTLNPTTGPFKGHRVQVIWKTNEGGNHHNHVHFGIR